MHKRTCKPLWRSAAAVVYTFEVSELGEDQIFRIIEKVPANIKDTVMSTADVLIEKGKRENTEKAIRNMIREGSTTEFICKVLEVSPDYVARIRASASPS